MYVCMCVCVCVYVSCARVGTWTAYVALLAIFWCCLYAITEYDAGRYAMLYRIFLW